MMQKISFFVLRGVLFLLFIAYYIVAILSIVRS